MIVSLHSDKKHDKIVPKIGKKWKIKVSLIIRRHNCCR